MIKINKYILIFFGLIFLLTSVYANYTVSDIVMSDVVVKDEDFNVSVYVSNNFSSIRDIEYDLNIFAPDGTALVSETRIVNNVEANDIKEDVVQFTWDNASSGKISIDDASSSSNSYLLQVHILQSNDGMPPANIKRQYFIVSSGPKNIPVPDMPIVFSFIFLIAVVFIFSYKSKTKK